MAQDDPLVRIAPDVRVGHNVKICSFVNLYGCTIGDETKIGTFVEIQKNVQIGARCKISSHSFLCEGVTIEDEVFIGHGVLFINDRFPRATATTGQLQTEKDWRVIPTRVCKGASIGSGAIILCGVTIGEHALIGAGAVVTRNVGAREAVAGVPARVMHTLFSDMAEPNPQGLCSVAFGTANPMPPNRVDVPFVDLRAQNRSLEIELAQVLERVTKDAQFILGPAVEEFETRFARYIGVEHCVGVNNGTSALHLALLAAGVGPGDEVITTPHSWISTAWAISYVGARPVFVDIDPIIYTLDPNAVEKAITPRTKALLPVHLYGQAAHLDPLICLAKAHGLSLVEDAAQAHGAIYNDRPVGSWGRLGCFSFYPSKNLGAFGEAGAVVTNEGDLADRVRRLRDHAQQDRHDHVEIGFNMRMEGIQGAVLDVKLRHLDDWNAARARHAQLYQELLAGLPNLVIPAATHAEGHVWHLYVVLVRGQERAKFRKAMAAMGVATGIHYPVPIPFQPAYEQLGYKPGDFPVAEDVMKHCVSLPMFAEMTDRQIEWTAHAVKECLS